MIDQKKLEVLGVWYACFLAIMDDVPSDPQTDEWRMDKLKILRAQLKQEAPGREKIIEKPDAPGKTSGD